MKRTAYYVFMIGLTPLIPLPFLDEYIERQILKRLYRDLAAQYAQELTDAQLDHLTEDHSSVLVGCFGLFIKWPLKKLFRTVFYFLTIKDVVDISARSTHRAAIIRAAFQKGHLPAQHKVVRKAMDAVLSQVDYSPITRIIFRRGSPPSPAWQPIEGLEGRFLDLLHQRGGGGLVMEHYDSHLLRIAQKDGSSENS
jgi:hypothetical protein